MSAGLRIKGSESLDSSSLPPAVVTLRKQVDSTARRLAVAEQALKDYEERSKLIVPDEQAAAQIEAGGFCAP